MDRYGWLILVIGAILGGLIGWLIAPILVPDSFFAGILGWVVVPVAAWIGLFVGYLVARWLNRVGSEQSVKQHKAAPDHGGS